MPLLRTTLYAKGVEIYCAPTVDDRVTWLPTMQTIAFEGRCFVVSASQYLVRKDCPADYGAVLQGLTRRRAVHPQSRGRAHRSPRSVGMRSDLARGE